MAGGSRQVEVRLLGAFSVFVDGAEVRVSAPRLRDLLAVLALSAGDPVSIATIGDRVWSEQPPDRLRPTVQTCISRLRTLLGPEVIRAHPEAYALALPRENIDVLRFTDELDRAHRLPVPADERNATAAALALWTGTPFSDLTADWFTTAALPGLRERYLAARERRIDLDIAGGAFEPLLVEVRDLTTQYPFREPLWERLIRLLDITGRHAEALACYDDVRRLIGEELGVDPGAELRALYAELLAADSAPPSEPAPQPARAVVPRQLPAENSRVTGREDELKELNELLTDEKDPATVIAAICGIGGAGKTSLAIRWAHRVRHLFPDGDLYLNLRGFDPADVMPTTAALRLLLSSLGLPAERIPTDEAAQSALLRSTLHGRRMLFLLDNARDADQLRPLLPARGCLVIATSRDRLRSLVVRDGAHRVTLGELPPVESERLIRSIAPDTEMDQVSELARSCQHLPLALAIIAEHAAGRSPQQVAELLAQLHAEQSVLDTFDGGDEATDLRAIFSWSHRALKASTARLYEHLGLLPVSNFVVPAAAALLGATVSDTRRLLARLADLHLVDDRGNGRYEIHDLVRAHAAELGRLRPDRTEALERLFSWYTHTGFNARLLRDDRGSDRKIVPPVAGVTPGQFPDAAAAVQWYDDERQTLAAMIRLAHATGHDRYTYELVESCEGDLSGRDLDLLSELLALAQDSCTRLDDPLPEAFINNTLGLRYMDQRDDCERAIVHFERAAEIFRAAGMDVQVARALGNLSVSHDLLGRSSQALDVAQQGLAIKRRIGDERGQAHSLGNMAAMYHAAGRVDEAAEAAGEAIRYYRTIHSHRGEGAVLDTLAGIERSRGRYDEALSCHLESVRLHRDLGFPWGEAVVLTNLGHTYHAVGRTADAKVAWQQALAICDRINAPRSEDLDREQLIALIAQD